MLTSPSGHIGVAWERTRGPLSMIAFAPLDLENAQLGPTRVVAVLGRRALAAAFALEGPDQAHVLVARRRGRGTIEVFEAGERTQGRGLVAIPTESADSLALHATSAGTLVLSWSEGEGLQGLLVRDREGHWGSPAYVQRTAR